MSERYIIMCIIKHRISKCFTSRKYWDNNEPGQTPCISDMSAKACIVRNYYRYTIFTTPLEETFAY